MRLGHGLLPRSSTSTVALLSLGRSLLGGEWRCVLVLPAATGEAAAAVNGLPGLDGRVVGLLPARCMDRPRVVLHLSQHYTDCLRRLLHVPQ